MAMDLLTGAVVLLARDDRGAAKRARDDDLLQLSDEADARGWSSSVPERSLALRRRRGTASSSSPRGCDWVVSAAAATAEEHGRRREEAAAVGAGAAAEENTTVDPCFLAYRSNRNGSDFDPPPMAVPLLPLCAFITDLWKARNSDRVFKHDRDEDLPALSEEADACGWSSQVPEHSLTPRRPTSSSSRPSI
jgi:hypothetical protein